LRLACFEFSHLSGTDCHPLLVYTQLILFSIIPTFFDIVIALVVFAIRFEWTLTMVIFCVMVAYGRPSLSA
jgi:ABC-type transport system involved in Fe-S cluster assembly fused permease/ATPase subunit